MVFVRIFSYSYPLILSSMYTLRHTYIALSHHLSLTKSGVRWQVESVSENSIDNAKRLLATIQ